MPGGCAFTSPHLGPECGVGSVFGTKGLRRALGDKRPSQLNRALLAPRSAGLVWGCGGSGKPGTPCHPAHPGDLFQLLFLPGAPLGVWGELGQEGSLSSPCIQPLGTEGIKSPCSGGFLLAGT